MKTSTASAFILTSQPGSSAKGLPSPALWQLSGRSLLARAAASCAESGLSDITVIADTGTGAMEMMAVEREAKALGLTTRRHPDWHEETPQGPALFLPVECALLLPRTIRSLLCFYEERGEDCRPGFLDKGGWPLLLAPASAARADLSEAAVRARTLPLPDTGSTFAINTPAALKQAEDYLRRTEGRSLPGLDEARHLLLHAELPPVKKRHSILVALGALRLGVSLQKNLPCPDFMLHAGAGLLHDMVRYQPRHAEAAARLLLGLGWPRTALAAGRHQQLPPAAFAFFSLPPPPSGESPTALPFPEHPDPCLLSAVLCVNMADKYTQDDQQVTLETRFARVGLYCAQNPKARAAADERQQWTRAMALAVRQRTGEDPLTLIRRPCGHPLEAPLLALLR